MGCLVDYDNPLDRGPGPKLGIGFEDTVRLWESTFGHPYVSAGSMCRGLKPVNLPAVPLGSDVSCSTAFLESIPAILPWDFRVADQNTTKYPGLAPRHVLQVLADATNQLICSEKKHTLLIGSCWVGS